MPLMSSELRTTGTWDGRTSRMGTGRMAGPGRMRNGENEPLGYKF